MMNSIYIARRRFIVKVIDLTHTIREHMPVFPGTEEPSLQTVSTYKTDGFKETKISICTHVGTHADPPAHVWDGGTTLDQYDAGQFIGKALVVDCRRIKEGGAITMDCLRPYGDKAEKADFLLFHTGWDAYWGTPRYFGDYPCIDDFVLEYVVAGPYKGIGFDTFGIDPIGDEELTRHRKLFQNREMINIENLKNLHLCGSDLFWFGCFPLKIRQSDGSPVRAVAWFE